MPVRAPPMITGSRSLMPASRGARLLYLSAYVSRYQMLLRIDHVGIACRSLESAVERYVSVFGLAVASEETNVAQGCARRCSPRTPMARTYSSSEPLGMTHLSGASSRGARGSSPHRVRGR